MVKLADFGLAKNVKNQTGNLTEYVSTRWYRAPELVMRSQNYTQSIDIFALGCVMAEMYLNRPLFPGTSESDQLTRILSVLGTPSMQDWPEGHHIAQTRGM
jgi:serine/threonine protein kinase